MIELAWVPIVLLFMVFCAFVAEHWPRHDPFPDERWQGEERRQR